METAELLIKRDYVISWHHPQNDINFKLSDLDGKTSEHYGNKDRDGKTLFNGQIKGYKDYDGKFGKGKIYHNINNMWWVIPSLYERRNIAAFHFFDDTFKQKIRRLIPVIKFTIKTGVYK